MFENLKYLTQLITAPLPFNYQPFDKIKTKPGKFRIAIEVTFTHGGTLTATLAGKVDLSCLPDLKALCSSEDFHQYLLRTCGPEITGGAISGVLVKPTQVEFDKKTHKKLTDLANALKDDPEFLEESREIGALNALIKRLDQK